MLLTLLRLTLLPWGDEYVCVPRDQEAQGGCSEARGEQEWRWTLGKALAVELGQESCR